jgi:hypothetical protein
VTHVAIRRGSIPADSFTIISNAWLRDPRLSLKAKGLAAYISSHAAEHVLSVEQILAENTDGKDAVRAGMAELEERGYLVREQVRGDGGRISRTDYVLRDPGNGGFASAGKPTPGPDQAKRGVFAGQNQGGFSGAGEPAGKKTTPPTVVKNTTEKTPSATPRGTRIPDDWKPSTALGDWLLAKLPEGRWSEHSRKWVLHETEKFTLYWKTKTGREATKLDWDRTWQKWMLTALERYRPAATGGQPAGQFKNAEEKRAEAADQRMVIAHLADAILTKSPGTDPDKAYETATAEVKRRAAAGEPVSVDSCTVPGYIEGVVIQTAREVTA